MKAVCSALVLALLSASQPAQAQTVTLSPAQYSVLAGYLDGLEALLGTTNTALTTIDGRVDGLEALLTTQNGYLDGLEALIGTSNSSLASIVTAAQLLDDAVYVDDADFTDDSSKGLLGFGLYQSSPQSITDGDVGPILLDVNGRVQIVGNVTLTSSVVDTELPSASTLANDMAIPSAPLIGAVLMCATAGVDVDFCTSTEVTEDVAEAGAERGPLSMTVRRDTPASSAGAANDFATSNTDGLGRLWTRNGSPCSDWARITTASISESSAATNEIVALNGSDLIYVCSYKLVTTAANSLSWTRGTGSDCGTGTTAIEAAQPYAANGGVAESGGGAPLFVVPAGNALCLVSSVATAHGGRISYVRTAAP